MYCLQKFNFVMSWEDLAGEKIQVKVFSDNKVCCHPEQQSTRPVKGNIRAELGHELRQKSVKTVTNENIVSINEEIVKQTGNLQSFKSPVVARKLRSEMTSKNDLDKDQLVEIHMMATKEISEKRLIQDVSTYPFTVTVS